MNAVDIPVDLDAPKRLLFWTFQQIIPFSVFFVLGMLAGKLLYGIVAGVLVSWVLDKYMNSKADGLAQHFLWYYGFLPLKGRAAVNPHIRRVFPG